MNRFQGRIFAYIILGVVFATTLQIHYFRIPFEEQSRFVEIAMEYGDLLKVARLSETDPLVLLERARQVGLTTLILLDDQVMDPDIDLLVYLEGSDLLTVAQLSNREEYHTTGIVEVFSKVVQLPRLHLLFFAGYEALGWPDQVSFTAAAMEFLNLPVGFVEMLGEQKGLEIIMDTLRYQMVRIHPGYPYEDLEDMVRSVRERGIRLLFLKPFKNMGLTDPDTIAEPQILSNFNPGASQIHLIGPSPLNPAEAVLFTADEVLLAWIGELKPQINSDGFILGEAVVLPYLSLSKTSEIYFQVSIITGLLLLLDLLCSGRPGYRILMGVSALGCLVFSLLYALDYYPDLIREIFALLGAMVFPSLGLMRLQKRLLTRDDSDNSLPPWRIGLQGLIESSLITICAALTVNAMLSNSIYLTAWRPFRGVKIALLAPPVLILIQALLLAWQKGDSWQRIRMISLRRLILILVGSVVGFIYIWRSGNEAATISWPESLLRINLERFLGVRPRLKEFLLGHPATMLVGLPLAAQFGELRIALLLLGAIAQASLFNTFMHLHVPLLLSLRRSLWGLALGEIIGVTLLFIIIRFSSKGVNIIGDDHA